MESLHERLIVHRDIKIENVLMSDFSHNSTLRIADLGSAIKLSRPECTTNLRIGTPGYMAPEVIRGDHYSFPCDIWSIGCLLHVLLCAKPPFWHVDRAERDRRVFKEELDLNSNQYTARLSPECKDLLHLLLNKDPVKRPPINVL